MERSSEVIRTRLVSNEPYSNEIVSKQSADTNRMRSEGEFIAIKLLTIHLNQTDQDAEELNQR